MRDYKLSKIYKLIILDNEDLVYYGSTIQTLGARLAGHKGHYKRYKEGKSKNYLTSFKLFETGKYVLISLVENYPCETKYELEARERFWIENYKCVNKAIPTRTMKEYRKANVDKLSKQKKEYYKANVDKIKEYYKANADKIKEYKKANADKIKEYRKANADKLNKQHKEWYKKNADKYKEYRKEYIKKNADKIKEYYKQKTKCEFCGFLGQKSKLKRHQRTIKCRKFQNNI